MAIRCHFFYGDFTGNMLIYIPHAFAAYFLFLCDFIFIGKGVFSMMETVINFHHFNLFQNGAYQNVVACDFIGYSRIDSLKLLEVIVVFKKCFNEDGFIFYCLVHVICEMQFISIIIDTDNGTVLLTTFKVE